jgi:hypothetical protein
MTVDIDSTFPLQLEVVNGDLPIQVGDTVKVRGAHSASRTPTLYLFRVDSAPARDATLGEIDVEPSRDELTLVKKLGTLDGALRWTHSKPGVYHIHTSREPKYGRIGAWDDTTAWRQYHVEPATDPVPENPEPEEPADRFNYEEPDDQIDPANYRGIVNAENDEGIALAPALRREGASLGPDGATVNLSDGETVDVGAIEEADEVARVLEGENAGDVIEADQPAVDGDPSSTSGGSDAGVIGAVGVGIVLLLAGAAALLGGS